MFRLIAVMRMLTASATCMLCVSGVRTIELPTNENVTVTEGQPITLQCSSSEDAKIALVEWKRSSNKTKLAVYHSNNTHHYVERITMEVNNHRSTISIKEALKEDKDWYFCIFQTFPNGKQDCKIYLDVKDNTMMKDPHMRKVSISVSVIGAAVVIMIVVLVIWKKKRKPAGIALDQKPQKNMPFYQNVDNVPNEEFDQNSEASVSVYENVDNITNTSMQTKQPCNNRNVTVMEGQSATLQCSSSEDAKIALVEWKKSSNKTKLAVHHSNCTRYSDERIKMEVNHQCSTISIEETLKSDEDWYFCIFQTFPNGKQDCKIYLEVKDEEEKFQASSFLAIYVVIGVVLAVLVIGKILLLIRYVHLRKSRVNIPNQINIILKNTEDTDDQDSKLQLTRPMVTNNQCEDTGIDYNYMSVSLQ
ncbi:uncharacterized protein LOC125456799 [Stegostoma tigrinum]|uniref:uncharacterized protein LOC125456799 n=1 Tax=Stegostoma tigrinum TaxID=3053191 RepID=UPI00202B7577|nr:uncharacterized protein LOC125456799 [Stegostoma tigrinum]